MNIFMSIILYVIAFGLFVANVIVGDIEYATLGFVVLISAGITHIINEIREAQVTVVVIDKDSVEEVEEDVGEDE